MLPTIAAVAAARAQCPHPARQQVLDDLALQLLLNALAKREIAQLRALLCRLRLDAPPAGGDDDERDAAEA